MAQMLAPDLRQFFYPGPPERAIKFFRTPAFRKSFQVEPTEVWQDVNCPVLLLHGELDCQVDAKVNLDAIETALRIGGNRVIERKEIIQHNHLFQVCNTGRPNEYANRQQTFSPTTLKHISDFCLAITK